MELREKNKTIFGDSWRHLNRFGAWEKKQACCAGCRRRPPSAEAPPIGKIHVFSKMAVTFEPLTGFYALLDLERY